MINIVSFSGGKDSTALLLMMIEKGMQVDEIIFCDTGKEFPDMLKHIDDVEKYIGRPITKIQNKESFDFIFTKKQRAKGKFKDVSGYGWPSAKRRWCTSNLKQQPFKRYIKQKYGKNYNLYIGLAYDEQKRVERNKDKRVKYPLVDWKITEAQALQYCYQKGFTWNGLYKHFKRVSCYLCPLQRKCDWLKLKKHYPKLFADALRLDRISAYKFTAKETLEEIVNRWEKKNQYKLFKEENND